MTAEHKDHDKEAKRSIQENIEQHGCYIALLEADNYLPGFAYTIGLYQQFNHPEVICFGLSNNVLGALLNHVKDLVKEGTSMEAGKPYKDFLDDHEIRFLEVEKDFYADYVGYGGWFYGNNFDFPLLQMVWPDREHKFPWEPEFNKDWKFRQPLLDRNTDFKFYEEKNLGVYTTSDVLKGVPVLYVYHNEDGDWQFHSSAEPDINDAQLVCLEEIIKLDPSLNDVYHLQYGWRAWRKKAGADWEYEEEKDED